MKKLKIGQPFTETKRQNPRATIQEGVMKSLTVVSIVVLSFFMVGCKSNGLSRLLNGSENPQGQAPNPPKGDPNAHPFYEQSTATQAQDDLLISKLIGTPNTPDFNLYVQEAWLPQRLNGVNNLGNGSVGYSSLLVDAWKALYRRGYADQSKLTNPGILHTNEYPVPVYQDDPKRWGLM